MDLDLWIDKTYGIKGRVRPGHSHIPILLDFDSGNSNGISIYMTPKVAEKIQKEIGIALKQLEEMDEEKDG